MLLNVKTPTIVGISTFMSRINFMLSWVEYEKSFITSGPGIQHKIQVGMCIQQKLKSVCASAQSDQSLSFTAWWNIGAMATHRAPIKDWPDHRGQSSVYSMPPRKRAKIRNRYNQAPHLTQDTNGKVTAQLDITNESQEFSPFPAGDHRASTNRPTWKHNKTRQK